MTSRIGSRPTPVFVLVIGPRRSSPLDDERERVYAEQKQAEQREHAKGNQSWLVHWPLLPCTRPNGTAGAGAGAGGYDCCG